MTGTGWIFSGTEHDMTVGWSCREASTSGHNVPLKNDSLRVSWLLKSFPKLQDIDPNNLHANEIVAQLATLASILIINANGQSHNFLARLVCTSGLIFDLLLPNVCLVECMYKRRIWQDIVIKKLGQIPTSSRLNMRLPNSEHDSFSGCKILLCCCLYHNAKSTKLNQCFQLCWFHGNLTSFSKDTFQF